MSPDAMMEQKWNECDSRAIGPLTWRVDSSTSRLMTTRAKKQETTQVVGVRMTPELAATFKSEAAKRRISGRRLFEEMWATYRKSGAKAGK
jgi:hypothetical protein